MKTRTQEALQHHKLSKLWELARPVLYSHSLGEIEESFFLDMDGIVAELHDVDPKSTALRYARTFDGAPSLGNKTYVLDIDSVMANLD